MRILYVITKSNWGGAQRYVFELAEAMHKDGHDVAVACGGNGPLTERLTEIGVRVFTAGNLERDVRISKEFASFFELFKIMRAWRPDVVHLNSSKAGGLGALVARLCGVGRIVFTAHGWPFHEDRSLVWKSLVFIASLTTVILSHIVIAVSERDAKSIPFPFRGKKMHTIHTAVPHIAFLDRAAARAALFDADTLAAHELDVWLVTIAELTPNKNLTAAIDAVVRYNLTHQQQIFYTIIGGGELRESLRMHISDSGAENRITLLGTIKDARTYLPAFDLFVLPSKKEGLPYVILEAGAAGLPVIASNCGGIPEVIAHEERGLLVDPTNTDALVSALDLLIQNPDVRMRYADALSLTVAHDYSFDEMYTKTKALYTRQ